MNPRRIIAAFAILLVANGYAIYRVEAESHEKDEAIVGVLVQGCELTRGALHDQVEQDLMRLDDTRHRDFPYVPKERFEELIEERRVELEEQLAGINPEKCQEQFGSALP